MIYCHKKITRKKKEGKEGFLKRKKKIIDLILEQYTNACKIELQIEMGKN
jgi:hypothetical protein